MSVRNLLESDACLHLGWILLHSLWQFALIGLIAAMLLACLRSRSHVRYAVAYTALLLMALAPLATYVLIPPPTSPFIADAGVYRGSDRIGLWFAAHRSRTHADPGGWSPICRRLGTDIRSRTD